MSRVLVIANQTLGSLELRRVIAERIASGADDIVVAAPMTHAIDLICVDQYGIQVPCGEIEQPSDDEGARARAGDRVEALLEDIRGLGASAQGAIGDADPWTTFKQFDASEFDEVIVSTLNPALSRWLRMDVVSRIDRAFHGPVHRVSAESAHPA
jgi:hypothetical protein